MWENILTYKVTIFVCIHLEWNLELLKQSKTLIISWQAFTDLHAKATSWSHSPHHLKNTQHFIQQLQGIGLESGEVITSFDVKALFTSVPVTPSVQIVKQKLQQDPTLPQRTSMSIQQITTLLEFCLTNTYFLFLGKYYEQVHSAGVGD